MVTDRQTDRQTDTQTDTHTHTHTHRTTTVTLAHARRGLIGRAGASPPSRTRTTGRFFYIVRVARYRIVSTRFYLGVHAVRNIARTVYGSRSLALAWTANTPAFLRKGRYGTTHLSQRRAHGPIRLLCAAQELDSTYIG